MKSTSSFKLESAKYHVNEVENGIRLDTPTMFGKLIGRKRPDGSYRRQCGEYVNDAIGIPSYFGNTLASKTARVVKGAKPAPGSAGVMDTGTGYGHVFLFEQILPKDRYVISESNFDDKENFRRIECGIADLMARGYVGCTPGLDMSAAPSPWAAEAFKAAKPFGFSDANPQEVIASKRGRQALAKDPLLKGHLNATKDAGVQYEEYVTALWKAGRFT